MTNEIPIPEKLQDKMKLLGRFIDELVNSDKENSKKIGWTIFMFDFGDEGDRQISYMSNADRGTMIEALCEFIQNAKQGLS